MQFGQTLEQLRAAGEETRLRILLLLSRSDLTVSELTRCLEQLQPRVSRHLRILVEAGLIAPYQEGSWRFYRLTALPDWLAAMLRHLEGPEVIADRKALDQVRQERADRAAAYFAENAERWDGVRKLYTDDGLIERALLELAPERIDRFADFGTGTGRMLILFGDRYVDGVGFDLSAEMLSVARVRIEEAGLRHARVRRRDILNTDQISMTEADLVCLHHVLHFLGEPERALASAAECLRVGGVLLIADFAPHDHEELRHQYAHRRLGFGDDEIAAIAARCGFEVTGERALPPSESGGLVSKIWRLEKTVDDLPSRKEEKALV